MRKLLTFSFVICVSSACTTVEEIRTREPTFSAPAKQNVTAYRDCVSEILMSEYGAAGVNKFSQGVVLGDNVVAMTEQVNGTVYVYQLNDPFLQNRELIVNAARGCNDDPNVGILDVE